MQAIANFEHVDKTASEPLKPTKDLHYNRVFAAELAETCGLLFAHLDDPKLQKIGRLKMEGYRDDEVGVRRQCSRRTVERKIELIRRAWKERAPAE